MRRDDDIMSKLQENIQKEKGFLKRVYISINENLQEQHSSITLISAKAWLNSRI